MTSGRLRENNLDVSFERADNVRNLKFLANLGTECNILSSVAKSCSCRRVIAIVVIIVVMLFLSVPMVRTSVLVSFLVRIGAVKHKQGISAEIKINKNH